MKTFWPDDPIPPIAANLQTGDDNALSPWILGPGLIVFGILLWIPGSPFTKGSELPGGSPGHPMTIFGFGLALVFAGVSILSRRIPRLARFGSRYRLPIIITGIAAVVLTFGPLVMSVLVPGARSFGAVIVLAFIINFAAIPLWILERRNARRVAAEMRKAVESGELPLAVPHPVRPEPANPGQLVIELYETADLPVAQPLRPHVTEDANIVGQPPFCILHLYNFFADAISAKPRPLAGWRLHGPVAMLASPLELARVAGYKLDLPQSIQSHLLRNSDMIDARVSTMAAVPLPPQPLSSWGRWKNRVKRARPGATPAGLPERFADSGAYTEEVLLCTDLTWQAGVQAITSRADKAIMDASSFSAERHGLIWEIQHVLDHFATEDFVVLVNSFTDMPALGAEFRRAWANMAQTSPNNRPGEAHLRIILLIGDDRGGWDDDNSLGGRSDDIRDWERIAAHHRIVTLLRNGS